MTVRRSCRDTGADACQIHGPDTLPAKRTTRFTTKNRRVGGVKAMLLLLAVSHNNKEVSSRPIAFVFVWMAGRDCGSLLGRGIKESRRRSDGTVNGRITGYCDYTSEKHANERS